MGSGCRGEGFVRSVLLLLLLLLLLAGGVGAGLRGERLADAAGAGVALSSRILKPNACDSGQMCCMQKVRT